MEDLQLILAANLKAIRDERGLSLDKVAGATGVSKSMLGQIERGESNPTLATVWKIANGLHVGLTELVKEKQDEHEIIRKSQVAYISEDNGKSKVYPYFTYEDGRPYEVYKVDMEPGSYIDAEPHAEGTVEVIVVNAGEISLRIKDEEVTLHEGDATRFFGDQDHSYHNSGKTPARLGIVIYYGIKR